MHDNLTPEEIAWFTSATTEDEWNGACDRVKAARGGQYPSNWWATIVGGGVMRAFQRRVAR